ncbi:MFS transporter [Sneathiella sp.]|uniref:MFS transporter n=1 Tax=Sneathiella sp. TaxID=1964365 RepID=UPI00261220C6|nr:MFS transporter [Sneathiella sp.]MDF2369142.1 MFS transporter [Sneathiella sp.]
MKHSLWILLLCAATILGLSIGYRQAMGLFLTPMTTELGVGRESFAFGMGLLNLVWGVAAPFAGGIADKYGAGRVAAAGGLFYAIGLVVMMTAGSSMQMMVSGTLIGLGLSGSGFTVVLGTVGRLVAEKDRSRALGIASVGGSVGQFLALPFSHVLISGFGWVIALGVLAVTALLIVPLAAGLRSAAPAPQGDIGQGLGEAFRDACRIPSFWLLNLGFLVCGFHLAFVAVHLPAFLADKGFEPWLATTGLTLVGLANIVGVYIFGYLGGVYSKKSVLSLLYLARALIFFLFIIIPITEVTVLVFSVAIGFLWLGTVPLTSGLVGYIFGTRYMSMLFGIVFFGHQIGAFLGSWLGGRSFDAFGSYDAIWWFCVLLGVMSAAIHMFIVEQPVKAKLAPA